MERRSLTGTLAPAALFSVVSLAIAACAWAQQPGRLPKIAILSPGGAAAACGSDVQGSSVGCFVDGLRALGYVDGRNVSLEYRFADGDYKRLPALASELVSLQPAVIYTAGPGAHAAASATTTIPIVVGPAGEETLTGLAGNLARPTGNVTGLTLASVEQELKCLQLVKELAPRTSRVVVLVNPDNPGYRDYPGVLAPAAGQLGLTLIRIEARNVSGLPQAFADIAASGANAIYLVDDPLLAGTGEVRKQVIEQAVSRRLPVASPNSSVTSDGGLVSLGTDRPALGRRAAFYVDKILKGAKPADLPVERPDRFKLSVNLKTAKALGLTIPQSLLLRADEVIQ